MMSFRRILSWPFVFQAFRPAVVNISNGSLGAASNFSKLIPTQSRCLFTIKSAKDLEAEAEKKEDSLHSLNNKSNNQNESIFKQKILVPHQTYSSLLDVTKKIKNEELNHRSIRSHLFGMLKLLFQNKASPDFSSEMDSFIKSEEFEKFGERLEQSLPMMTTKDLYLVFQVLHYYRIPYSSILMQKLHALILDNINSFDLTEVIKMYLIIKENDDKLLQAVKNAFVAYMDHLAIDNIKFLGDLRSITYFASKEEVPFSMREILLKKVLSLGNELKELDPVLLSRLSFPLCSPEFKLFSKKSFIQALKETIPTKFEFKQLKIVLDNILNGIRKKVVEYDRSLFDCVALAATKFDMPLASYVMTCLLRIGHVNYTLADFIAEEFTRYNIDSLKAGKIEEIICNFATINYKNYSLKDSNIWSDLEYIFQNYIESGVNFKNVQTPLSLLILGIGSKEFYTKVLQDVAKYLESMTVISVKRAFLLYHYYCSVYSGPPENMPKNFVSNCESIIEYSHSYGWREAMLRVFDGEDYVLTKCKTPFGTLISYVVILGPDRKPINLSSYKTPESKLSNSLDDFIEIEKIERPPDSKVFAFIECGQEPIRFRNCSLLRPEPRLITNVHKEMGYRIFHLYSNQSKLSVDNIVEALLHIMRRELNYIISKESELQTTV